MNIRNQLYSSLSQLTRQSVLMQTELSTFLNVFETDYELQYSESYTASKQKVELYFTDSVRNIYETTNGRNFPVSASNHFLTPTRGRTPNRKQY